MQGDGKIKILEFRIHKGNKTADFSLLKPGNVWLLGVQLTPAAAWLSGFPTRQLLQAVNSKDKGQYPIVERIIKEGSI